MNVEEGKLDRRNDKSTLLPNLGNRDIRLKVIAVQQMFLLEQLGPSFHVNAGNQWPPHSLNRCSGYIPQRSVLVTQDNS